MLRMLGTTTCNSSSRFALSHHRQSGNISAGVTEASDDTRKERIAAGGEDDRDDGCRPLRGRTAGCAEGEDDVDIPSDKFCHGLKP